MAYVILFALLAAQAGPTFDYDASRPHDIREVRRESREGTLIREITFAATTGARTGASIVQPPKGPTTGAVLFVHWYEPESKDSNRTQYVNQAVELARLGATSLLVDTMWSQPDWFPKRKRADDFVNSVAQVKELRRALDVLLSLPGVNKHRVAYVGHDFGAMYGSVLASVENGRVHAWALQAGTTEFPRWFLYGPPMEPQARDQFIQQFAPIDPVRLIGLASPAPVLFQFGRQDKHVPVERAEAFFAAARDPKKLLWYDAGHGLNEQAIRDRQAWLKEVLRLR